MTILRRRYPCCNGPMRLPTGWDGQPALRRCTRCRRWWVIELVDGLITERHPEMNVGRIKWREVENGESV